jgi:hypothetical protein
MDTLRAALPTFDRKGQGYDGDDDVIEISDSKDGCDPTDPQQCVDERHPGHV